MKLEFSRQELDRIENDDYLTDRERQAFRLYYRRGWKVEDIAAELDVSRRTITTILQRVRRKALH